MNSEKQNGEPNLLEMRKKRSETLPELKYLRREAAIARSGMSTTLGDMKDSALQSINPVGWCRRHPWITTGGVFGLTAALGCALGRLVKHSIPVNRTPKAPSDGAPQSFMGDFMRSAPIVIMNTLLSRFLASSVPPPSDTAFNHGQVEQPGVE